jgi:hypothetical protein
VILRDFVENVMLGGVSGTVGGFVGGFGMEMVTQSTGLILLAASLGGAVAAIATFRVRDWLGP